MRHKWQILMLFVSMYIIGILGAAWHTYGVTDTSKADASVETIKVIFIMLGGLGVIVPTYLNVWQSLETARLLQDQTRRDKIENTFRLLEKWDDSSLLEARRFIRELNDKQKSVSSIAIEQMIKENPVLRHSVILLFNYWDLVRVSIENDRIDPKIFGGALGNVFHGMHNWLSEHSETSQADLRRLAELLPRGQK